MSKEMERATVEYVEEAIKKIEAKDLQNCNARIVKIKEAIKRFKNYRKWYKPLYWGMYSKRDIKEWVNKYYFLLRLEVKTKRLIMGYKINSNSFKYEYRNI